jgi:hypothetical protein
VVAKLQCDDKHPLELVVKPYRKRRTNQQNSRYWAILHVISERTGYTGQELHLLCKDMFLGRERYDVCGKVFEVPRETKHLNTVEFSEYCDRVEDWAASEHGLVLPAYNY